jgi:hypothetical protein
MPLFLLAGCWVTLDEVQSRIDDVAPPDAGDTDEEITACQIESIVPPYGTTAGGSVITITVAGLDEAPAVDFGAREATVVGLTGNQLVVQTPDVNRGGDKTVLVQTSSSSCFVENGFTYHDDAKGLNGAIGVMRWTVPQGTYWSNVNSTGFLWFKFVEPTSVRTSSLFGDAMETCRSNFEDASETDILNTPQIATIEPGLDVPWVPQEVRYELAFAAGFEYDTAYDLAPLTGDDSELPPVQVTGFVQTPPAIEITVPDVNGADLGVISKRNFSIQWSTVETGDYVLIELDRYVGSSLLEYVDCWVADDGSFVVPPTAWTDWQDSDQYVVMRVGRVRESMGEFPHDRSGSDVAGIVFAAGGAVTTD